MRTNYIKSTTHNENSLDYRHRLQKCRGRSRIKFLSISCCLKTSPLVESVGQAGHQGDGEGDGLGCNPVKPHLGSRFIKKRKVQCSDLTPLLLPSVAVCPEKRAHPWKAPPPETEKSTTTLEAATAAVNLRSVGGGKLQTPAAWLMAASSAARLPALGFTMKYLETIYPS